MVSSTAPATAIERASNCLFELAHLLCDAKAGYTDCPRVLSQLQRAVTEFGEIPDLLCGPQLGSFHLLEDARELGVGAQTGPLHCSTVLSVLEIGGVSEAKF